MKNIFDEGIRQSKNDYLIQKITAPENLRNDHKV